MNAEWRVSSPKGRSAAFPMVQLWGLAGGTYRHTGAGKCLFLALCTGTGQLHAVRWSVAWTAWVTMGKDSKSGAGKWALGSKGVCLCWNSSFPFFLLSYLPTFLPSSLSLFSCFFLFFLLFFFTLSSSSSSSLSSSSFIREDQLSCHSGYKFFILNITWERETEGERNLTHLFGILRRGIYEFSQVGTSRWAEDSLTLFSQSCSIFICSYVKL